MLEEIIENQKRIIGIVIEFHNVDYHRNVINDFCKRLNLNLIHIHPNNFAPKDNKGDPTVIELTFERDPIFEDGDVTLPHELDMKNNPLEKDINLVFLP
jgi:nitrogenase subunit NifH